MPTDRDSGRALCWRSPTRAVRIPAALSAMLLPLILAAAALCGLTVLLLPLLCSAAGLILYARRYLQSCCGEWKHGQLRICRGVWFRREWVIAQSAVRELDVFAPPLHRLLSCRTFRLRYAGGSVWIPPIDIAQARRLQALWEELS